MPNMFGGDQFHPAYFPSYWENKIGGHFHVTRVKEYVSEPWNYRLGLNKKGQVLCDRALLKELRDLTGSADYIKVPEKEIPAVLLKRYKKAITRPRKLKRS